MVKVGDKVTIMNSTPSGNTIVEGTATVREIIDQDTDRTFAKVEFDGEPGTLYERFIWE
jgi:hypothetical protein